MFSLKALRHLIVCIVFSNSNWTVYTQPQPSYYSELTFVLKILRRKTH